MRLPSSAFSLTRVTTFMVSLVLLVGTSVVSQLSAVEHGFKPTHSVEGVTEYRLENGLKILLIPDPSVPTLSVNLIVRTGSRRERYGETGLAHLLEHVQFKGTERFPDFLDASSHGGWAAAAYTWFDFTSYQSTMSGTPENLDRIIEFEADRFVNARITTEDLKQDVEIVLNELENAQTFGVNILSERMIANAYEWHNYGKATIGSRSDLTNMSAETVQAFYKTFYRPDNATLVLAGRFDKQQALQTVQRYFGTIPRPTEPLPREHTEEHPQYGERLITVRGNAGTPVAGVFYHTPGGAHPDYAAVEVLVSALIGTTPGYLWASAPSRTGPLHQALVDEGAANQLLGRISGLRQRGSVEFYALLPGDTDPKPTLQVLTHTLEDGGFADFSDSAIESAKQRLLRSTHQLLTDLKELTYELRYWESLGDWRLLFLHRDRVERVTAADVRRVAQEYLHHSNRTAGLFIPAVSPTRVAIPHPPDVPVLLKDYEGGATITRGEFIEPEPGTVEQRVVRQTLTSGVRIALLPKKTRGENIHFRMTFRNADTDSIKGRTGALFLLPKLITSLGAKTQSRKLTRGASGVTSSYAQAAADGLIIKMRTERRYLSHNLEKLGNLLREPLFTRKDFETLKQKQVLTLENLRRHPLTRAEREVGRLTRPYPSDDPRHVDTVDEELERMKSVAFEDVVALYNDLRGAVQVGAVALGDFEAETITRQIESVVGAWQSSQPFSPTTPFEPQTRPSGPAEIQLDESKAAGMFGVMHLPVNQEHPDFPALTLAQRAWRITRVTPRLNLETGISYFHQSTLEALPDSRWTRLSLRATCNSTQLDALQDGVRDTFESLRTKPFTLSEFEQTKRNLANITRVRFWSDDALMSSLANSLKWDRTFEYDAEIAERIESLTIQEVQAAAEKYLDFNKMVIAVAGDIPTPTKPLDPNNQ